MRGREGHTGLSAMLDQRVRGIGFCQGDLVGVGEVEVIEADNLSHKVAVVVESGEEEGNEGGFPDALDAVDAYEERGGGGGGSVVGMAGEDEGDAVAAFVVYYFRHVIIYDLYEGGVGSWGLGWRRGLSGSERSGELHSDSAFIQTLQFLT